MMALSKKRRIFISSIMLATGVTMLSLGHGCSDFRTLVSSTGDENTSSVSGQSNDFPIIPKTTTVSTGYSKQILDNMVSCIGTEQASTLTMEVYQDKKGSISERGNALRLTAPMLMAVMSVAGEVCNDLIEKEEPLSPENHRIFKGIDLTSGVLPADESFIKAAATRLTNSCWQRPMDDNEWAEIRAQLNSSIAANGVVNKSDTAPISTSRNAALFLCTSVLASLDSYSM